MTQKPPLQGPEISVKICNFCTWKTDSFPFQQKLQTAHLFNAISQTPERHLTNVKGTAHWSTFLHILFALFHNVQELLLSSSLELHILNRSYRTVFSCASLSLICIFYNFTGYLLEVQLVGDSKTTHKLLLTKPTGRGTLWPLFVPTPTSYYRDQSVAALKFHPGHSVIADKTQPSCNNFNSCRIGALDISLINNAAGCQGPDSLEMKVTHSRMIGVWKLKHVFICFEMYLKTQFSMC